MSDYVWLNEPSQQFLEKDYLLPGQTVDDRVTQITDRAEEILDIHGFAARFKENFQKGWYSFSTPVWVNFGTDRGLPISCFGSYVGDDMAEILGTQAEVGMMTKNGGGTSAYFGDVRSRGSEIKHNGHSFGSVHFMELFDKLMDIVSQGATRRGSFAAYLPIDHGDIEEFLTIRREGSPLQKILFGVTVPEGWMQSMIDGDPTKRRIWAKIIESRGEVGGPYLVFQDNANAGRPDVYADKGMEIRQSNLCTEIMLPTAEDESFVCDLSSMNVLHFDEWRDTDAVWLMTAFLDAVMTEFIDKASKIPFMERSVNFARRHRAIGIGQLGWHSYLQSKMIPYESMQAKFLNVQVAKTMKDQAYEASHHLAALYGEPELLKGYGRRNATLLATAPTKSSAFILGQVSEGIEPQHSNYYVKDLQKGKFEVRNPHLGELLQSYGHDDEGTWDDILRHGGSVQHLGFLTEHDRLVFKTFAEISPMEVVIQASQRQKHIDQSQSLNLMIPPDTPVKDINALFIRAWELGVKSLYYQLGVNAAQHFTRDILECSSCEA